MNDAARHLDKRFSAVQTLKDTSRPPKGWLRAVRDALGMTTAQLAKRLGVSQPRVVAIEHAEVDKAITLKSLERAAEALGCRVIYFLVPEKPLEETLTSRATQVATRQLEVLGKTMQLEDQAVRNKKTQQAMRAKLIDDILDDPARLWDETW